MLLSGLAFVLSVPVIALSQSFTALFLGRLLQGISGGLVGVVVPLYLAECLSAKERGRGTAIFQWLLTLGIFAASLIGVYYSYHVDAIAKSGNADVLFAAKNSAWRQIFWMSMPPGLLFVLGSFFVSESPRWLFRRGRKQQTEAALLRSRTPEQAALELSEMEQIAEETTRKPGGHTDSLLQRRYMLPFLLACVILACNTATGINSVIGFNTNILLEGGLSDVFAHWGYVVFTAFNFFMTLVGMQLVDRKGRKFLFTTGTTGIIISMVAAGSLFHRTESHRFDARAAIQPLVNADQLTFKFDESGAQRLAASGAPIEGRQSFTIIYSYGPFAGSTTPVRLGDPAVEIHRSDAVPSSKVESFFRNPLADLGAARNAPLTIEHAYLTPIPSALNGWLVAIFLYTFVAFYAMGPGVCVWLALSELMPTRIRSNGMSIALVINQFVSATLAAIFLPMVGKHGYSSMFFLFAGFTVIYLATVVFFLPETKGKTLEEIEKYFESA